MHIFKLSCLFVPEDNVRQNPNESYTSKYQKHAACSYGYKLVCVDHKRCCLQFY